MLRETEYLPPSAADQLIFDTLVREGHYLRQVKAVVDFERFRAPLASCYCRSLGRPAKEPLLLLKLEFLQYQYGLSDREVMEQSRVNMAFRFFLDLSLTSELPHHTLLTYFRERVGVDKHQQVFQDLIAQARERGLVKDRLRLKDATHILANIAIPSTITLVSQTRERLLEAVRPYAPERVAQEEAEAVRVRTVTADLSDQERLLHRVNHLRTLAAWVEELLGQREQAAAADADLGGLRAALTLTHKVLHDRDDPKAKDKVISVHDEDARNGWHHQWYAGYLLDTAIDADSELITAINVLPSNGDEAADATTLIQQEEQAHGNDVAAMSIDGAGFRGGLLREWTDPQGLNLEVFVPPKEEQPLTLFRPDAFTLDVTKEALTCPNGQTTRKREYKKEEARWVYRFKPQQCAGCPLREKCLQDPEKSVGRTVSKTDYEAEYRAAREKAKTPEYEKVRREHPRVERKLGELARWHDGRHARYRGLTKVLVQALLTGLVVNVKRLAKLIGAAGESAVETVRAGLAKLIDAAGEPAVETVRADLAGAELGS